MKPVEQAAARAERREHPSSNMKTGEWDDLVSAMGDEFIEVPEETTEKALSVNADLDVDEIVSSFDEMPSSGPVRTAAVEPRPHDEARARARRATVVSPIPAMLAQSMGRIPDAVPGRDSAAVPLAAHSEVTRPVAGAAPVPQPAAPSAPVRISGSSSYDIEVTEESIPPARRHTMELIERARSSFQRGDLASAVLAADEVLAGGELKTMPGLADLIESARPLFDRIFVSYIGLLGEVPVMARPDEEVAAMPMDDKTRQLVSRVDGVLTLEQLFKISNIPAVDVVRIAASLMCAGIIRVV